MLTQRVVWSQSSIKDQSMVQIKKKKDIFLCQEFCYQVEGILSFKESFVKLLSANL